MTKTLEQLSADDLKSLSDLKTPPIWEGDESLEHYARCIAESLGSMSFKVSDPSTHFIEFEFENKEFVIRYAKTNRYEYILDERKPAKYPWHFNKIKEERVIASIEYEGELVYHSSMGCNGFDFTVSIDSSGNWENKIEKLYERAQRKLERKRGKVNV